MKRSLKFNGNENVRKQTKEAEGTEEQQRPQEHLEIHGGIMREVGFLPVVTDKTWNHRGARQMGFIYI